jgi:hypothetical protein
MLHREGIAIPRSTSISRDLLGACFELEFDANVILENIIFNCFNALSILP